VRALDATDLDLQLVVVCGRNTRLRARLVRTPPRHPARVLGFVDTMPELMHAADVVVTKGGPTTISEALASSRPVVVTSIIPGQEEGNDRLVEREGVGFGALSTEALVAAVARLAGDPALRAAMAERAVRLVPLDATARTADLVVSAAAAAGRWPTPALAGRGGA
jgi:1,2-diacylglycerol 3-beta-galactosyltransferase